MRIKQPKHRNATINTRTMFYALYGKEEVNEDEFTKKTGYYEPVEFRACLSTGQSNAEESPFGANVSYDRVISTVDTSLPIDENSIIWVKTKPTYLENGSVDASSADYKVAAPPLDGLNSLRIAVKKVLHTIADSSSDETEDKPSSGDNKDDGF